jgi:hypothetical protein
MSEETPDYAKPTIAMKAKDHQINRIVDVEKKSNQAKMMITTHNELLKTERLNPERYTRTGFKQIKDTTLASAKVLSKWQDNTQDRTEDVKEVQVKTANKAVRIMRQEAAMKRDPGNLEMDDDDETKLESFLIDIISKNLADKMPKGDPEYKTFKENYDWVLDYYQERFDNIPDEIHHEIFCGIDEWVKDFVQIISKSFFELPDLTNFFWSVIKKLNPLTTVQETTQTKNKNIFGLVIETVAQIGNQLLNTDPQQTETYFLEYAMDNLIEIIEENVFKRNEMMYIFYCFVSNTVNSHLRVLGKLKEKLLDKDAFYYCLSKLILFENSDGNQELAPELYQFYFENSAYGLMCSSPITWTKCVTILSSLSKTSIEPIVPLLSKLEVYANDTYWELKG